MSHSDRTNWKQFFANLVRGDSFHLDKMAAQSARTSAGKYGIRLLIQKEAHDWYKCTILDTDCRLSDKETIIRHFRSLPIKDLKAIYKAATQAGLI
jgi:hypothetical protein